MHVDSTICSPCWRDANAASILTPCWIIGQQTIAECNVEQTKDVRMYTWRIYSSRYLDTLLYMDEVSMELNCIGICSSLYTIATIEEKGWDCSQMYNWHCRVNRIRMKWEPVNLWANVRNAIPMFASCLTPVSVNGNLCWLLITQTARETCECHSCN